jgi:hypothetical protein
MFVFEIFTARNGKLADTAKHATTEFHELMKTKKEQLKALKNYQVYQQMIGPYGKFYMVWEVDSFADFQQIMVNMRNDEELSKYLEGWNELLVDGSCSIEILNKIS